MAPPRRNLSEYQGVWLLAMFDLPVDSKKARKAYSRFRKALLKQGFMMMQFSVYARYFASEESSATIRKRIEAILPSQGHVRLLLITDRQFGKMEVFDGKTRACPEEAPKQLLLF